MGAMYMAWCIMKQCVGVSSITKWWGWWLDYITSVLFSLYYYQPYQSEFQERQGKPNWVSEEGEQSIVDHYTSRKYNIIWWPLCIILAGAENLRRVFKTSALNKYFFKLGVLSLQEVDYGMITGRPYNYNI